MNQLENDNKLVMEVTKMGKTLDPEQLKTLLTPNLEDMLIKPREKKEDSGKILAIKLSDEEASTVQDLQDFLFDRDYIPDNSFESVLFYLINLAGSLHKPVVEYETKMGRAYDPEDFAPKSQD
jgi:hypothetical protein